MDDLNHKYRFLDEVLLLLKPGGIYAIDETMLSRPNWPEGHGEKVEKLIATLEGRSDLRIIKMSWASGIILATKI